ncbi:VWA domain-containing protein [uncultured Vibrio sp.]|uniref:vWA domain-containing protein n=1 Tax=uncultured Vibrio sp. TaxID=114054 RepID=UPI0025CEA6A3|nr:VWA domain-containing protein [uncultured Vibrio sp.]
MNWEFVSPWAFIILPLPLLIWRFSSPQRVRMDAVLFPFFRQITEAAGIEAKPGAVILRRRRNQIIVATLCWILTVIGLARPEILGQQISMEKSARDMMLAVDISASMSTKDMVDDSGIESKRLDVVKSVVDEFIEDRESDRIGLIVFGSRAFLQSPFTEDHKSVQQLLSRTRVEMAGPYTAIGDTIGLAINAFKASALDQRMMILLSDGSDTSSMMSPSNAAEIAVEHGVTIHTVGVGNPDGNGSQQVDLELLQEIADRTGGRLFFADDAAGLSAIYDEIDALSPRVTETLSFQPTTPVSWVAFALAAFLGLSLLVWLSVAGRIKQ